jgi:hypothetical protein
LNGTNEERDSRKPDSPEAAERYDRLRDSEVSFVYRRMTDEISSVDDSQYRRNVPLRNTLPDQYRPSFAKAVADQLVETVARSWAYLPAAPKRIRDTWSFEREATTIPAFASVEQRKHPDERTSCTFNEVRMTPTGTFAIVSLSGSLRNPLQSEATGFHLSGEIQYDLATKLIAEQQIELSHEDATMSSTFKFRLKMQPYQPSP